VLATELYDNPRLSRDETLARLLERAAGGNITVYEPNDWKAPYASGSAKVDAYVRLPIERHASLQERADLIFHTFRLKQRPPLLASLQAVDQNLHRNVQENGRSEAPHPCPVLTPGGGAATAIAAGKGKGGGNRGQAVQPEPRSSVPGNRRSRLRVPLPAST